MSLPVPPAIMEGLREFLRDGKSGQVVWEVRGGEIVAVAFTQKIRIQGGTDVGEPAMEFKLAARR